MPLVMDDFREMASTSMAKAVGFFNQVSTFCNDGSRNRMGGIDHPNTIFILPKNRITDRVPYDEPIGGENGFKGQICTDGDDDDMSSLTEPPVFRLEKPYTADDVSFLLEKRFTKRNSEVELDRPAEEEFINFEAEHLGFCQVHGDHLFDDILLGMAPPKHEPEPEPRPSPSLFARLDPPLKHCKPLKSSSPDITSNNAKPATPATTVKAAETGKTATPVTTTNPAVTAFVADGVQTDTVPNVSKDFSCVDPRFRFPFGKFRSRTRKQRRPLAALHDDDQSQPPPPPPPPPAPAALPDNQCSKKKSGKPGQRVQVIWGSEVPKPGFARSLRQFGRLRPRKGDLESVEC